VSECVCVYLCVCVCHETYLSSTQSACAVFYCHVLPVWLYRIFPHFLTNVAIFRRMSLNIKSLILFSLQLVHEIFLILRRIHQDVVINVYSFHT